MGVENYTIGKGRLSIDGTFMGNAPECSFEITVETKQRMKKAASSCTRYVASTVILSKRGKLRFQLDEFSSAAVALATGGKMGAMVVLQQTNVIGPSRTWTFDHVNIMPSNVPLISSEFSVMEFEGDVLFDSSLSFGSVA